jgi:hypothetical protein
MNEDSDDIQEAMSTAEPVSADTTAGTVDVKLEVVVIAVSGVPDWYTACMVAELPT